MKHNLKIIGRDNFCRDNVSEILVLSGLNKDVAQKICDLLNLNNGVDGPWSYYVVEHDYQLYVWEP